MRIVVAVVLSLLFVGAFADDESLAHGREIYSQTCVACHAKNGKGALPGVQDLTSEDGPLAKSDEDLVRSIVDGLKLPNSPLAMPPNGGNPTLSATEIRAVLAYLRNEFGR